MLNTSTIENAIDGTKSTYPENRPPNMLSLKKQKSIVKDKNAILDTMDSDYLYHLGLNRQ